MEDLKSFQRSLVNFTSESVTLKGYITVMNIFGPGETARNIEVSYIVIDVPSSYNMTV